MSERAARMPEPGIAFGLRLFNTVGVLFAVSLLARITAPGINPALLPAGGSDIAFDSLVSNAVSVNALQFSPAISALVIYELFRLLLPGMRHWESEEPGRRGRVGLLIMALLLAAYQAWGVAGALEEMSGSSIPLVMEPGSSFRASYVITQIAGTALLILAADTITRYGIGSGWWVMIAAAQIASLIPVGMVISQRLAEGMVDPLYVLALFAIAAAGGYAAWMLFAKGLEQGRTPAQSAADLILPAFLGVSLGAFLYGLGAIAVSVLSGEPVTPESFSWVSPGALGVTAALILLFARLRCATDTQRGWQIAALVIAVFVGLELAGANIGLYVLRADVLIMAVMIGALAWQHWKATALPEPAA